MNDKSIEKRLYAVAIGLVSVSWIANNLIFTAQQYNVDLAVLLLVLIFIFYRWKYKMSVQEVLMLVGLKPIAASSVLKYVVVIGFISFALAGILAKVLAVDLNLYIRDSSAGAAFKIAKYYSKPVATIALLLFSFYGTFVEEFIFRGLILRKLLKYPFYIANGIQAALFGFIHYAITMLVDLPSSFAAFMFLYPFIMGLLLGYAYKKSGQNLVVSWSTHYFVNTVTWLLFLYTGNLF